MLEITRALETIDNANAEKVNLGLMTAEESVEELIAYRRFMHNLLFGDDFDVEESEE